MAADTIASAPRQPDPREEDVETLDVKSEPESDAKSSADPEHGMTLTKTKSLEHRVSLPREVLVVGLIDLAQLTTQMGLGQMLAILHVVGDHFEIDDPGVLAWLIAGYSLTVGTFILFSGRLGDLFGWKNLLVIGYTWYAIWSLVAGLSWYSNHVLFIFARVFQGIGPAICLPNALALLGALYEPGKRKNMVFSSFGAAAPGGAVIGAVFAGLWTLTWWPWAFFSFSIALFIIAAVASWAIPDPQEFKPGWQGETLMDRLADTDFFGAAVGITGLVLFNFAWNQAPIVGWQSPYVIVTLILGLLLLPAFIWIELRMAPKPLIPLEVFTSSNAFVLGCLSCGWATFGILFYYAWQILEVLRGTSPLLATAYLSPIAISGAVAAISTGILLGMLRPAWVMIFAMCAFLTGTILIATLPVHQIYWGQIFVMSLIATFGMDMSFPSATIVLSNSVAKAHQGVAASLVNTIVNYSISLGLGFAGTVEVHVNNGGKTDADILKGYRGALYMGIGLSGLGLGLAIIFLLKSHWDDRKVNQAGPESTKEIDGSHA